MEISNISTYGVRALFYINVDDAPRSKMFDTFDEGSNQGLYTFSMTYAGDYTVTGILLWACWVSCPHCMHQSQPRTGMELYRLGSKR